VARGSRISGDKGVAQGVFGIALEPPDAHAAEAELLRGLHVALPEAPSGNLAETTRPSLANPGPVTGPVRPGESGTSRRPSARRVARLRDRWREGVRRLHRDHPKCQARELAYGEEWGESTNGV
jgi:hypothetical protein